MRLREREMERVRERDIENRGRDRGIQGNRFMEKDIGGWK